MNLDSSGRALPRQYNYQRVNQEHTRNSHVNGHYSKYSRYDNDWRQIFGGGFRSCLLVCALIVLTLLIFGFGLIAGHLGHRQSDSYSLSTNLYETVFGDYEVSKENSVAIENESNRIHKEIVTDDILNPGATFTESFRHKVSNLIRGRQNGGMSSGLPPVTLHFDQNGNLLGNSVKVGKANGINVQITNTDTTKEKSGSDVREQQRLRGSSQKSVIDKSTEVITPERQSEFVDNNEKKQIGGNVDTSLTISSTHNLDQNSKYVKDSATQLEVLPQTINYTDGLIDTPILIISHNRADYLKRTLNALKRYHPCNSSLYHGKGLVPIIISEDGEHAAMKEAVDAFREEINLLDPSVMVYHINHKQDMSLKKENMGGYLMLSQHFKWALNQVFHKNYHGKAFQNPHQQQMATISEESFNQSSPLLPFDPKSVIVLEEDLEISPDFFVFFGSFIPLLYSEDSNLLTISAWNDNGIQARVKNDAGQFYRSDFFPGLGWVMTSKLWNELGPKWPRGFWDDWMREPEQRKARQIIRPDLSRTLHFGDIGTSGGQHRDVWKSISPAKTSAMELEEIVNKQLNRKEVGLGKQVDGSAFSILRSDELYHEYIQNEVSNAETKDINFIKSVFLENKSSEVELRKHSGKSYKVYYDAHQGPNGFERLAKTLSIMSDEKAMVPRTAYEGIVIIWLNNAQTKLMLVPRNPPTKNYKF